MQSVDVNINPVYFNYINAKQRLQIFFGGSSSGKSYFLSQRCILNNMKGANYLICRQSAVSIRKSCFNEILKAINYMGLKSLYHVNNQEMVITNTYNGKQIMFTGLFDTERLKSISPRNGILEHVWIEEATETSYHGFKQLQKRLRGLSDTPKIITLSFNPVLKTSWVYYEFFKDCWDETKTLYKNENKLILKTTYRDNKYLTKDDIALLESETDPYYIDVYLNGNWGILGKVIYKKWKTADLSKNALSFDNIYCGVDFGWNDPNAFLKIHVDNDRKIIYVIDEIYRRGITIPEFSDDIKNKVTNTQYIFADCAEPRSIHEMNQLGLRVVPVKKGADSILHGIKFLQRYEIIVDIHCQNFINEISQYHWQEDKNGNALEVPVDINNHLLDCLRYACSTLIERTTATAGVSFF